MAEIKRTRKSAPVKNAVFLGAMHKDKARARGFREVDNISIRSDRSPSGDLKHSNGKLRSQNESKRLTEPSRNRSLRQSFTPGTSLRMSTPVRKADTSPRYRTRHRSRQGGASEHDRSRSFASSTGSKRRFHPDYDPLIEIRRAKERLERYRKKDDWTADMLLSDDADEDLFRYEEKLKRRLAERGELMEPIELERRQLELLRRQRDIDMGKVTDRYAEYVLSVPKPERQRHQPRTPNKFRKVSRRAWDGMIRKWRKHLHNFDDMSFEDSWRSLSSTYMSGQSTPSHSMSEASSDYESENIAQVDGVQLTAQASVVLSANLSNPTQLTSRSPMQPNVCLSNIQHAQNRLADDDEDTLQANPKVFRGEGRRSPNHHPEDDDTLSGMPAVHPAQPGNRRRVTRSLHSQLSHGPSPDVLHSGLTNDMTDMCRAHKRSSCHLKRSKADIVSVDITDVNAFPSLKPVEAMASPSKRQRRGILSQNDMNVPSSSLFASAWRKS